MANNPFEQMAKRYDSEERIELSKIIRKEVRSLLQNSKSKSLLDYGSGGYAYELIQISNQMEYQITGKGRIK